MSEQEAFVNPLLKSSVKHRLVIVYESLRRVANQKFIYDELDRNGLPRARILECAAVQDHLEKPKKKDINRHRPQLEEVLAEGLTKTIVLLVGNVPLQSVTGSAGIKQKRGRPFERGGNIYLPMMAPGLLMHDDRNRPMMEADMRLFCEIAVKGEIPREEGLNWTIVDNERKFEMMLKDLDGTVSFDIETNGLYPWKEGAAVQSIGFGTRKNQWCLPLNHPESVWPEHLHQSMMERIAKRLKKCFLVAHNGKFDSLWLCVHYEVDVRCDFDTMLAHWALDENARHGLKLLAQVYYGAPNYDADLDTKQGAGPLGKHCLYLAHDVFYTRKLRFTFGHLLAKDAGVLQAFERITMPCASIFCDVEYDGVFVDIARYEEAEVQLRRELGAAERELRKFGDINWRSPKQLAVLFFDVLGMSILDRTDGGAPSTNESVLKRLDHPAAKALMKYRAADQLLKMFIDGWKEFLDNGRLHPNFKLHGTVTGRPSCEHPNLQQVPRDSLIRSLIIAEPGWDLIDIDLSQIEMRIAAELSGEKTLLQLFDCGDDVHWLTALREIERGHAFVKEALSSAKTFIEKHFSQKALGDANLSGHAAKKYIETKMLVKRARKEKVDYGIAMRLLWLMGPELAAEIDKVWKEARKKAKAINFGYLFGMWWKKFKIYARDNYGVDVTDEEAKQSRKTFFTLYPGLAEWHIRQRKFARRHGYVRSLSGALRRLPAAMSQHDSPERGEAERQAINSPVQRFACELNLMTLIQLTQEFGRDVCRPCGTIHDAILIRTRRDWTERIFTRALEIMQHPQLLDELNIKLRVPVLGEAKIGPWSKGVSLEKWKSSLVPDKAKSTSGASAIGRTTTSTSRN